jgi:hypothetical protein
VEDRVDAEHLHVTSTPSMGREAFREALLWTHRF